MTDEQQLCILAEMLTDLDDLTAAVAAVLEGAQGAGVDPRVVAGLQSALVTLDPGATVTYNAGDTHDRHRGTGYASDGEFLEAVADAEDQVQVRCREVGDLQECVAAALERVKARVSPRQFQIFDCYVLKGWGVTKTADALGINAAQVYLAKHRVGNLVKKEVQALEGQLL